MIRLSHLSHFVVPSLYSFLIKPIISHDALGECLAFWVHLKLLFECKEASSIWLLDKNSAVINVNANLVPKKQFVCPTFLPTLNEEKDLSLECDWVFAISSNHFLAETDHLFKWSYPHMVLWFCPFCILVKGPIKIFLGHRIVGYRSYCANLSMHNET